MEGGVFTVKLSCLELEPPALAALAVKVKTPGAVGVPLTMPVEDSKESPAGSVPLVTLHVMGAVPVADRVCVYTEPVSARAKGDVVTMEGGVFTVKLSCLELEPPALAALAVKVKTPGAVGVPLTMPVEDPRESPAGSVPLVTLHVIGAVPVADRVWVYTDPVSAAGKGDVVPMEGGAGGVVTVRLNCWELEPPALVAVILKVKMPGAVGMPPTMPVDAPKESPGGSAPLVTLHAIGAVPMAARVCA